MDSSLFSRVVEKIRIGRTGEAYIVNTRGQYQTERLENYDGFNDLEDEQRSRIRYARAMLSHGVATSPNTGMNKIIVENDNILARFLTTVSRALFKGYETLPPLESDKRRLLDEKIKKLEGG